MGADMYLAAAIILCDEMSKSYNSPIRSLNHGQQIDKRCGFTSANPDYEMLMPVIFNLKHGIELYLKALIMQVNTGQEYPTSHDLLKLLNQLILEINNNKYNIDLKLLDQDLREIIEQYYFGLYAFALYKINPDIKNEAERYPEHINDNCYEIKDLYDINFYKLLNKIKKDCVDIQRLFRENVYKRNGLVLKRKMWDRYTKNYRVRQAVLEYNRKKYDEICITRLLSPEDLIREMRKAGFKEFEILNDYKEERTKLPGRFLITGQK